MRLRYVPSSGGPGLPNLSLQQCRVRASVSSVIKESQWPTLGPGQLIHECVEKEQGMAVVVGLGGSLKGIEQTASFIKVLRKKGRALHFEV